MTRVSSTRQQRGQRQGQRDAGHSDGVTQQRRATVCQHYFLSASVGSWHFVFVHRDQRLADDGGRQNPLSVFVVQVPCPRRKTKRCRLFQYTPAHLPRQFIHRDDWWPKSFKSGDAIMPHIPRIFASHKGSKKFSQRFNCQYIRVARTLPMPGATSS